MALGEAAGAAEAGPQTRGIIAAAPQAPTALNHVWSYDFVFDRSANGQQLKCLTANSLSSRGGSDFSNLSSFERATVPSTEATRPHRVRSGQRCASDPTDADWALIEPHLPLRKRPDWPRTSILNEPAVRGMGWVRSRYRYDSKSTAHTQ